MAAKKGPNILLLMPNRTRRIPVPSIVRSARNIACVLIEHLLRFFSISSLLSVSGSQGRRVGFYFATWD
jgi:hypothetical protein